MNAFSKLYETRDFDSFDSALLHGNFPGYSNWFTAGMGIEAARVALNLSNWTKFSGLSVVDFGCGVDDVSDLPDGWPPLYSLLMANIGACVTGCDVRDYKTKKFHFINSDLVDVVTSGGGLVSIGINSNTINVVNTSNYTGAQREFGRDVTLNESLKVARVSSEDFERLFESQIFDLLVSGGVWIQDGELRLRK